MSYKNIVKKLYVDIDKRVMRNATQPLLIECDITVDTLDVDYQQDNDGQDKDNPSSTPTVKSIEQQQRTTELDQSDSGANRIVTNNLQCLRNPRKINPIPMGSANTNESADIICTYIGELPIHSNNGEILYPTAYYCENVDGTIISPTTITTQFKDRFSGWLQHSNIDDNKGTLTFISRTGDNFICPTICENDLWFHVINSSTNTPSNEPTTKPTINKIGSAATYELWHQRTAHAGTSTLEILHKHVDGVPKLRGNAFYKCPSCMSAKLCTKQPIGKKRRKMFNDVNKDNDEQDDIFLPNAEAGQHFHLDFGFVRGSDFNYKTKTGSTITSIDGKNSYLSIIDRATRFMWVFTMASKSPPVEIAKKVLYKFKSSNPHRTVRVDQGGELGKSEDFRNMVGKYFSLELTGADASAQNGMVENPNRTLGQMMRCQLHAASLGPEYWTYALTHSIYIKNRLPHHSIGMTPYEKFTGKKPNLSRLRIFGSCVYTRKPGKRPYKLDNNSSQGIFVGYSATDKNIYYIDEKTGRVKSTAHAIFDEAHMSVPASKAPIAAQTLQRLGYHTREDWVDDILGNDNNKDLIVQKFNTSATIPSTSTDQSIGYDLHYCGDKDITILPGKICKIPTGIGIQCPTGTYGRIAPRSGLTVKQQLHTLAGVIDPDYRGELQVILHNFGNEMQTILPNQRIAQLILEQALTPSIQPTDSLTSTQRGDNGFGSTEARESKHPMKLRQRDNTHPKPTIKILHSATATPTPSPNINADLLTTFDMPYDIHLSSNPFDNYTHRDIQIKPKDFDPYLGFILKWCTDRQRPQLLDCRKGSSSIRIPSWRSELRHSFLTSINGIPITSMDMLKTSIQRAREKSHSTIRIGFATIHKQALHPQHGIPQLYQDQMNVIAKHLWEIRNDAIWQKESNEEIILPIDEPKLKKLTKYAKKRLKKNHIWCMHHDLPKWYKIKQLKTRKKLTRRYLLAQSDWDEWKRSEYKQLDQYDDQGTFGIPCKLPEGANCLPLLWTYLIKDCGTKKARCVCNGSPKLQGSVTLGPTYASALDQTGSRIFWAATAINNYITIGADASNAFAEAPAPVAPLYVTIDQPYREWYQHKYPDKPPLPSDYVLPVKGALQGHPESARLWALLIDKVIKQLNLKACTHEPCLYYTNNYNNTGKTVLFLRQVDDFAVSCQDKETALDVIEQINKKMTISVKQLGVISRFNGVDILQSQHYIKLYNLTYIDKILQRHEWIHHEKPLQTHPTPMNSDNEYQRRLEQAPALNEQELKAVEKEMGFKYRQAIGELIYALVTCRPDISYAIIKLSQYSTRPSRIHFEAVKQVYRYLNHTKHEGMIFWRKEPRLDLPYHPPPTMQNDNNYDESEITERQQNQHDIMFGAVDSDYGGDTSHRRSVTGIIVRMAGGTIFYKTKFQDTVSMSSTEAEFIAAAEAGKYILYLRSILQEIGLEQQHATILFEDNQGALLMANAQRPTKRTRHMEIKHFALQDWVLKDLLTLKRIDTKDNYSDVMTKATARVLFHRHINYIMGKIKPQYVNDAKSLSCNSTHPPPKRFQSTGG